MSIVKKQQSKLKAAFFLTYHKLVFYFGLTFDRAGQNVRQSQVNRHKQFGLTSQS